MSITRLSIDESVLVLVDVSDIQNAVFVNGLPHLSLYDMFSHHFTLELSYPKFQQERGGGMLLDLSVPKLNAILAPPCHKSSLDPQIQNTSTYQSQDCTQRKQCSAVGVSPSIKSGVLIYSACETGGDCGEIRDQGTLRKELEVPPEFSTAVSLWQ